MVFMKFPSSDQIGAHTVIWRRILIYAFNNNKGPVVVLVCISFKYLCFLSQPNHMQLG